MDALERAQKKYDQARERLQKAKAIARTAERKRDTRRKIILGGIVIAEARRDPTVANQVNRWIAALGPRDAAIFQDWTTEKNE